MNLTIKNLPDDVYKILKRTASERGRSLNAQIIEALSGTAEEAERRRKMRKSRAELERLVASLPPMPDSVPLIRAERRSR